MAGEVFVEGIVQSCVAAGSVSGIDHVGGIAGQLADESVRIDPGIVRSCAALNSSISARLIPPVQGRVAGSNLGGLRGMMENYAWSGMRVGNTTTSGFADDINGADVDSAALQTLWTTGALKTWDTSVWTLAGGRLPVLTGLSGQSDVLPAYIGGLASTGTSGDPYRIYTADDLKWLADQVKGGEIFDGTFFRLENDIDLSAYGKSYDDSKGWEPIGTKDPYMTNEHSFAGTFDGNGKTITGLYINREDTDYIGLFGYVNGGTVQNLSLRGIDMRGRASVGGVVEELYGGMAENCAVSGNVAGGEDLGGGDVGGVAGSLGNDSVVQNCAVSSSVSGQGTEGNVGGVVGTAWNNALVRYCAALNPSVSGRKPHRVGTGGGLGFGVGNYAWSGMNVNGSTVSGGGADGENAAITMLLRASFWRDTLCFSEAVWSIADGRLPYLKAFPDYALVMGLISYFPPADSGDMILTAAPPLLRKSPRVQTVTLTATGAFRDTAWPELVWETSEGSLAGADTFSAALTVPAGFTGAIAVRVKLASFPSLPGKSVTVLVNSGSGSDSDFDSGAPSSNAPTDVTTKAVQSAAKNAVAAAKASGASTATANIRNPGNISLAALQVMSKEAGIPLRLQADNMNGRAVDVRITLDPAKSTANLNLSASTVNSDAKKTTALFEKYFRNTV